MALLAVSPLGVASAQGAAAKGHRPQLAGFLGVATAGGAPVVGARLEVFTRSGRELKLAGTVRTNRRGGFHSGVHGLTRSFVVKVDGGTVGGVPFRQSLYALAHSREKGVVVNPATTVAVAFVRRHPRLGIRASAGRIRALLGSHPRRRNINSGHEAYMTCGAGSYPNVGGAFQCSDVYVNAGYTEDVLGVTVFGALATSYDALQGTSVSSGSCGEIPYSTTTTTGTPNTSSSSGVRYCTGDTYGLLVDTHAPAPGAAANGVLPPFWALSMLVGPPPAGVPATPVPPPA